MEMRYFRWGMTGTTQLCNPQKIVMRRWCRLSITLLGRIYQLQSRPDFDRDWVFVSGTRIRGMGLALASIMLLPGIVSILSVLKMMANDTQGQREDVQQ